MRIGYFRIGVFVDEFDVALEQLKNVPLKSAGGTDPFVTGSWRTGHIRTAVYLPLFDEAKESLKKKV
jgi:hypothetical protein